MGFSSTITIYRKYLKENVSEEEIKSVKEQIKKCEKEFYSNRSDEEIVYPVVLDKFYGCYDDYDKHSLAERRNRFIIDGHPCDKVLDFDFGSSFRALSEDLYLGQNGVNEAILTVSDCRDILIAVKYLLSGKYYDDFEDILNNRWVHIFGDDYPKYMFRHSKKELNSIENEEENRIQECILNEVRLAMEVFASHEYWDEKTEFVCVYSISY